MIFAEKVQEVDADVKFIWQKWNSTCSTNEQNDAWRETEFTQETKHQATAQQMDKQR